MKKKPFLVELEFLIESTTNLGARRIVERELLERIAFISAGDSRLYVRTWEMRKVKDRKRMLSRKAR